MAPSRLEQLIAQRDALVREAIEAKRLHEAALKACQPYDDGWNRADRALRVLHENRAAGEVIDKAVMLAAYDARLEAGYVRSPHKKKHEELGHWLERVLREHQRLQISIAKQPASRADREPLQAKLPWLLENIDDEA